jgi:hypothetical protein
VSSPETIEAVILKLTAESGSGQTISPADAAKALGAASGRDWHQFLQPVRQAAIRLAREGRVVIMRKGKPADPDDFKGVYRLGAPTT